MAYNSLIDKELSYISCNPFGVIAKTKRLTPHNVLLNNHGLIFANRYRRGNIIFENICYDQMGQ